MISPSQANQVYWDGDAASYHAEHPDYLSSFYWCPEMLHEDQVHLLGDVSDSSVLEIGCGSAPCTEWLQTRARFATGFDISRGMLNHAAGALPLTQADALSLPYATESFDAAFSAFGAFPFLANLDLALQEVSRVLKPDGRFVLSVTHPMRWIFPDDPTDLTADISYFDRAYLEQDRDGNLTYAEFHRTIADWFQALQGKGPFLIEDIIEPEWPQGLSTTWGQWSPERGEIFPGTIIFVCRNSR